MYTYLFYHICYKNGRQAQNNNIKNDIENNLLLSFDQNNARIDIHKPLKMCSKTKGEPHKKYMSST